jgi:hypothetical protein
VVSTCTFFTERIQQGDIDNTRVLEIDCLNEETWLVTLYWVLVNDNDTIEDIELQWLRILWGNAVSRITMIKLRPLFLLPNGRPLAGEDPVRSIPAYSTLAFSILSNAELAAAHSSDRLRS